MGGALMGAMKNPMLMGLLKGGMGLGQQMMNRPPQNTTQISQRAPYGQF
jgi:hypothetical protein